MNHLRNITLTRILKDKHTKEELEILQSIKKSLIDYNRHYKCKNIAIYLDPENEHIYIRNHNGYTRLNDDNQLLYCYNINNIFEYYHSHLETEVTKEQYASIVAYALEFHYNRNVSNYSNVPCE